MITRAETQQKMALMAAGALRHSPDQTYTVADRYEEKAIEQPDTIFLIYKVRRDEENYYYFIDRIGNL